MDPESVRGMGRFAMQALRVNYSTEESQEGVKARSEKQDANFMKYYK